MGTAVGYPCPACNCDTAKIVEYQHVDNRPWGLHLRCIMCKYEWFYGYFEENYGSSSPEEDNLEA